MRTIAFVTQKGGSGKSTIASSIAVAAAQGGERVVILDMDPQASLVKWAGLRETKDIVVEAVSPAKLKPVLAMLAKKGVTLCVIDTPGGESPASEAAMKAADFCVIPARPNVFDLWSSETTRKALKGLKRDYAFLLNQCPPAQQSARVEEGAKALEALGAILSPLVAARVDYQEAARRGLGVTELSASSVASEEMRKLWLSIRRRIGKAQPVRKAA